MFELRTNCQGIQDQPRCTTEQHLPWQNCMEAKIWELKKGITRAMRKARMPCRLWDFCGEWVSAIRRYMAHEIPLLEGRVPAESIEGNTPDISEYFQFDWYQYIWYHNPESLPCDNIKLWQWIGVAHNVGAPLTSLILPTLLLSNCTRDLLCHH
jgi:hypothetical protein